MFSYFVNTFGKVFPANMAIINVSPWLKGSPINAAMVAEPRVKVAIPMVILK